MDSNRTPTLGEVIAAHITVALEQLRVAQPARVESYNDAAGTVEVTPLLRRPVHLDDGSVQWVQLPRLPSVPVCSPSAGGRRVKLPISTGDVVLLVFCDFGIDGWKAGEGTTDPLGVVTPATLGTHQVADAIAIPGLFNPLGAAPLPAIEIQADGNVILAGGGQGVGLGSALRTELDALWTAITAHVHPGVQVGSGSTSAAVYTPTRQTVESSTVKTAS
jgi:hypothetical protein